MTDETALSGVDAGADSTSTGISAPDYSSFSSDETPVIPQSDEGFDFTLPASPEETAAPEWLGIVEAVDKLPADDSDLNQPNYPHVQGLREQRQQIRTLTHALREQEQLVDQWANYYGQLGNVENLQAATAIRELLYTPLTDNQGYYILDPKTQTPYFDTTPLWNHLDEVSPGMPEQALTDLLAFQPMDERGQVTLPLYLQVLNYWDQQNPDWWRQRYGVSDSPSHSQTAITAEELAEIPLQYHEAYRHLAPSIRNAWLAYDEADQLLTLQREQQNIERDKREQYYEQQEAQRAEGERHQYLQQLQQRQAQHFDQVRRERFTVIAQQLAQQVAFSADPATDIVMRSSVLTLMSNLLDPDWRFVSAEALKAMGIQLGQQFDAALNSFNTNAANQVAFEMAGDMVQAQTAQERANDAVNFLTTKLGIIALAAAKKMGGQQKAAAATQAAALNGATTTLPNAGYGTSPNGQKSGILPPGMAPGSAEAARWLASQTGFVQY